MALLIAALRIGGCFGAQHFMLKTLAADSLVAANTHSYYSCLPKAVYGSSSCLPVNCLCASSPSAILTASSCGTRSARSPQRSLACPAATIGGGSLLLSWLSSPMLQSATSTVAGARQGLEAATKKGSLDESAVDRARVCRGAESMELTPLAGTVNLEPELKLVAQSVTWPCYSYFAVDF